MRTQLYTMTLNYMLIAFCVLLVDHLSSATAIRNSAVLSNVTQRHEQFSAAERRLVADQLRMDRHNIKPRRIYTAEELMNTRFPSQISDDIDMDPCKSGGLLYKLKN